MTLDSHTAEKAAWCSDCGDPRRDTGSPCERCGSYTSTGDPVRALHHPDAAEEWCAHDGSPWPCPTVLALSTPPAPTPEEA